MSSEMFEERAAIMEFDGGLSRKDAEAAARAICIPSTPAPKQEFAIRSKSAGERKPRRVGPGYAAYQAFKQNGGRHGHQA